LLKRNIVKKIERKHKLYCSLRKSKVRRSNQDRVDDFSRSLSDCFDVIRVNDAYNEPPKSSTKPCCTKPAAESGECSSTDVDYSTDNGEDEVDDFAAELSQFQRQKISPDPVPTESLVDVILRSRDIISMADRINLSDRKFLMLVAAIAKAAGENIDESTFSRTSLQKIRNNHRDEVTSAIENAFRSREKVPLTVHWDGKIMKDFGADENSCLKTERHAVVVSGSNVEKILGIPPINSGTGWAQAKVC
jgi:hypothetical protein